MSDLKKQNEKQLITLLLIAVVALYLSAGVLYGERIISFFLNSPLSHRLGLGLLGLSPLICLKAILVLLSDTIPTQWKEKLVHTRWNAPLPGCRADKLIQNDHRINTQTLPLAVSKLLDKTLEPKERNAHWYSEIWLAVRDLPAVSNTHRKYILYRDAASGTLLILIITIFADIGSRALFNMPILNAWAYVIVISYLVGLIAAANQFGNRMVTGSISNFINKKNQGDNKP